MSEPEDTDEAFRRLLAEVEQSSTRPGSDRTGAPDGAATATDDHRGRRGHRVLGLGLVIALAAGGWWIASRAQQTSTPLAGNADPAARATAVAGAPPTGAPPSGSRPAVPSGTLPASPSPGGAPASSAAGAVVLVAELPDPPSAGSESQLRMPASVPAVGGVPAAAVNRALREARTLAWATSAAADVISGSTIAPVLSAVDGPTRPRLQKLADDPNAGTIGWNAMATRLRLPSGYKGFVGTAASWSAAAVQEPDGALDMRVTTTMATNVLRPQGTDWNVNLVVVFRETYLRFAVDGTRVGLPSILKSGYTASPDACGKASRDWITVPDDYKLTASMAVDEQCWR